MGRPNVPVTLVPAKTGETFKMGPFTIRILEDGSNTGLAWPIFHKRRRGTDAMVTDNRIGAAEITVPARTEGPPAHWHEMHDETFLVTKGKMLFHYPGKDDIKADQGDYVVVPVRAPHTFSNPYEEEATFFNTYTPAFYINYFKLLGQMEAEGRTIGKEEVLDAMAHFATLPVIDGNT